MLELRTLVYDRATKKTTDSIYINFSAIMDAIVVSLFENELIL